VVVVVEWWLEQEAVVAWTWVVGEAVQLQVRGMVGVGTGTWEEVEVRQWSLMMMMMMMVVVVVTMEAVVVVVVVVDSRAVMVVFEMLVVVVVMAGEGTVNEVKAGGLMEWKVG
jgi:hypothetical protein